MKPHEEHKNRENIERIQDQLETLADQPMIRKEPQAHPTSQEGSQAHFIPQEGEQDAMPEERENEPQPGQRRQRKHGLHRADRLASEEIPGRELREKRGSNRKIYDLGRGAYQAVLHPEPIHYQDAKGQWQEIDNTLVATHENGKSRLRNRSNNLEMSLAEEGNAPDLVRLTRHGRTFAWGIQGAQWKMAAQENMALTQERGDAREVAEPTAGLKESAAATSTKHDAGTTTAPDTKGITETARTIVAENALGASATAPVESATEDATGTALEEIATPTQDEDLARMLLQTQETAVRYEEILPETDLVCYLNGQQFKDEIILKTAQAPGQITLNLQGEGLTFRQTTDGSIEVLDGKQRLFTLPPAFAADAAGREGTVNTELLLQGGQPQMILTVDKAFLDSAAYPITIDPIVNTEGTTLLEDNYTSAATPDTVITDAAQKLRISNTPGSEAMAYLRLTELPELTSAHTITKAYLSLALQSTTSLTADIPVFLREVTSPWSADTLTWNNRPTVSDQDADYILANKGTRTPTRYEFDISSLVRQWYAGENHGLRLDIRKTTSPNTVDFCAQGHASQKPIITINYMSHAGLVSHLSYESLGAGHAGSGHVNLFNGNFVFAKGLTASNGLRMPVSLAATYNACALETPAHSVPMGHGWKLSADIQLWEKPLGTAKTFVLAQGDGSQLDFKLKSGQTYYEDLSGLSLKLTLETGAVKITDKSGTIMTFSRPTDMSAEPALLQSVADARGNTIRYWHCDGLLHYISDGAGRKTLLRYEDGRLDSVLAPGETIPLRLIYDEEGNLTQILDTDGTIAQYSYAKNGPMTQAQGYEGLRLSVVYGEAAPRRVEMLRQHGIQEDGTWLEGASRSFHYGDAQTISRDETVPNGKRKFYLFNDWGNQVGIRDELGFAGFAKYNAETLPNHPEQVSKLMKTATTLSVPDSRFDTQPDYKHSLDDGTVGSFSYDTTVKMLGARSLKLTKIIAEEELALRYATQTLEAGKTYTFSAYVKTQGPVSAHLSAQYEDADGQIQTQSGVKIQSLEDWARSSVTFTLPPADKDADSQAENPDSLTEGYDDPTQDIANPANQAEVTLCFHASQGLGSVWIDCVQLEEGPTLGSYNLLANGDFHASTDEFPDHWTPEPANDPTLDKTYPNAPSEVGKPDCLTPGILRLHGDVDKTKGFHQELSISGAKEDAYVFGGWARGAARPIRGTATKYGIRIQFKVGSSWKDGGNASWNEEWSEWQFISGAALAPDSYTALRFYLEYEKNLNHVDLDGMMLYKENFGKSYGYDDQGNVLDMTSLAGLKLNARYNTNSDLTSYQPPGRTGWYSYSYGSSGGAKRQVTSARTPAGLTTQYTYDAYGNVLQSQTHTSGYINQGDEQSEQLIHNYIRSVNQYSPDGNYLTTTQDARGKKTEYLTDLARGTLLGIIDPMGQSIQYEYDEKKRLVSARCATPEGLYQNSYHYDQGRLTFLSHNTMESSPDVHYSFDYDALGHPTETRVGERLLSRNVYENRGDRLLKRLEYGNGNAIHYRYDAYKRLEALTYDQDSTEALRYSYGHNGKVQQVHDYRLNQISQDEYDGAERLARHKILAESTGDEPQRLLFQSTLEYDGCNRIAKVTDRLEDGRDYATAYTYDQDDRVTKVSWGTSGRYQSFAYDAHNRMTSQNLCFSGTAATNVASYSYCPGGHDYGKSYDYERGVSYTALVSKLVTLGKQYDYTYDDNGNLLTEKRNNSAVQVISYEYDRLGQLRRANDPILGKTWLYRYDFGGNLLETRTYAYTLAPLDASDAPEGGICQETHAYGYGDLRWKDKLTAYDGQEITYDAIGNPLEDGRWEYTWCHGRRLIAMQNAESRIAYVHDYRGRRVKKVVNGVETQYTYHGKHVVHLRRGDVDMHFWYGGGNRPAIVEYGGAQYFYIYNLQGDVMGLVNSAKQWVVEYLYDPWGRQLSCTGTMATTLGTDNPFRYRSYQYDQETGLYFLRSRYYNPNIARFLNADGTVHTGQGILGANMFAYCLNNPVNKSDPSGCTSFSWAKVIAASHEYARSLNASYRESKAKQKGILHILDDKGNTLASIGVEWDTISAGYHIDTRFLDDSTGRAAMMGIIGTTKNTEEGFKINGNKAMILPAVLEIDANTLLACAVRLYPHSQDKESKEVYFREEGGHFDVYMKDSKQKSDDLSAFVLEFRNVAIKAGEIAQSKAKRIGGDRFGAVDMIY